MYNAGAQFGLYVHKGVCSVNISSITNIYLLSQRNRLFSKTGDPRISIRMTYGPWAHVLFTIPYTTKSNKHLYNTISTLMHIVSVDLLPAYI